MQWKDLTTRVRHKPDQGYGTFEAVCGPVRIVVTNTNVYFPGRWVASACMTIDVRQLHATTLEEAQDEAIQFVRSWLEYAVDSLGNLES
jgi:hypothetical protein